MRPPERLARARWRIASRGQDGIAARRPDMVFRPPRRKARGDAGGQPCRAVSIAGPARKSSKRASKPARSGEQHIGPTSTGSEGGK